MDDQQKDTPVNIDLEKGASKDFEIRTMADDLKEASTPPPPPGEVKPSEPSPPPPALEKQPPEFLLEDQTKGSWLKSFLIGFGVVLVVGLAGIGAWWYLQTQQVPEEVVQPPTLQPPTPLVSDTPLIPVDETLTLELLPDETSETFFTKLASLVESVKPNLGLGSIVRVILVKDGKLLTLKELEALVKPEVSLQNVNERFTLVLFFQDPEPVFGLIGQVSEPEALKVFMSQKEQEIPLFYQQVYTSYTKTALPSAASPTFLDNIHQGVAIRYINFDTPSRSFDYAFYNNLFLFAGSREAMYALIDRVKLTSVLNENEQ